MHLWKGNEAEQVAKVYDSPSIPEAEAIFDLSDAGIVGISGWDKRFNSHKSHFSSTSYRNGRIETCKYM
jgi:hypothetical protein